MKVKINDKIFSSSEEPIMIIMTEEEKKLISSMAENAHSFASAPDDYFSNIEDFQNWMESE